MMLFVLNIGAVWPSVISKNMEERRVLWLRANFLWLITSSGDTEGKLSAQ